MGIKFVYMSVCLQASPCLHRTRWRFKVCYSFIIEEGNLFSCSSRAPGRRQVPVWRPMVAEGGLRVTMDHIDLLHTWVNLTWDHPRPLNTQLVKDLLTHLHNYNFIKSQPNECEKSYWILLKKLTCCVLIFTSAAGVLLHLTQGEKQHAVFARWKTWSTEVSGAFENVL